MLVTPFLHHEIISFCSDKVEGAFDTMENPLVDPVQTFNCSLYEETAKICGDGFCVPATGACDCTFTYVRSGQRCEENPYTVYGAPIYVYQYVFAILFSAVALAGSYSLAVILKTRKGRQSRLVKLLFGTVTLLGFERAVWLWIDPHGAFKIFPTNLESVLFGFAIWLDAFIFFIIVEIWLQIMAQVEKNSKCVPVSRVIIWVVAAVLLVFQIVQDGLRPSMSSGTAAFIINLFYWISIGITCITACVFSLIWGCAVSRRIKSYARATESSRTAKKHDYFRRIWNITLGVVVLTIFLVIVLIAGFIILFLPNGAPPRFYVIQTIFRCFELAYPVLVLWNFSSLRTRQPDSSAGSMSRSPSGVVRTTNMSHSSSYDTGSEN